LGYNKPMATATIEIDERVAAALRAQADALRMPLTAFLEQIAASALPPVSTSSMTEEEWNRMFDEVSSDASASLSTFSRAEIYSDHD